MQVSFSYTKDQEREEVKQPNLLSAALPKLERKDWSIQILGPLIALVRMGLVEKDNLSTWKPMQIS